MDADEIENEDLEGSDQRKSMIANAASIDYWEGGREGEEGGSRPRGMEGWRGGREGGRREGGTAAGICGIKCD